MIKRIKDLFRKKEIPNAEHVMTVKGHKIYVFKHFTDLSTMRAVAVKIFYHQLGLGVQETDYDVFQDMIDECINEGNFSKIGALNQTLRQVRSQYCSPRVIMAIASWGILVDDEPYKQPEKRHQEIKEKLIQDPDVKAFFLNTGLEYLVELSSQADTSKAREYMNSKKAQRIESIYSQMMSLPPTLNTLSELIPK